MRFQLIIISLFLSAQSLAQFQLRVQRVDSMEQLVSRYFLGDSKSLDVTRVRYKGSKDAIGRFSNDVDSTYFFQRGIVLTTGRLEDVGGPNNTNNSGIGVGERGWGLLGRMARNLSMDAAILSFEFETAGDSIEFDFVFASEEYPEFVDRGVNDVFAFFLTDLESQERVNIALIPGTLDPITIDNVNQKRNHRYYQPNRYWDPTQMEFWQRNLDLATLSNLIQFDGMTVPLKARSNVTPGKRYRLEIAISDIGDNLYDSAVFLKGGSLKSRREDTQKTKLQTLFPGELVKRKGDSLIVQLHIRFDYDSHELGDGQERLLETLSMYARQYDGSIMVIGHTDDAGEPTYNLLLSKRRADSVSDFLVGQGVAKSKLSASGRGEEVPLVPNTNNSNKAKNRRVEIVFY